MMTDQNRPRIPEVAVGASAAVSGVAAVFAWAACCVLPLALSVAGVSFAGAAILAGARYRTIPWQMGVVTGVLRLLPRWLFDRVTARRKQKPRAVTTPP